MEVNSSKGSRKRVRDSDTDVRRAHTPIHRTYAQRGRAPEEEELDPGPEVPVLPLRLPWLLGSICCSRLAPPQRHY